MDLRGQLLHFLVDRGSVGVRVGVVKALHGQFPNALQIAANHVERTLCRLGEGDAVIGISLSDGTAPNARGKPLSDGEACGVVPSAVNAQARGQTLDRSAERVLRAHHVSLGR